MNSKLWIQKAFTMCLLTTLVATYSMVALANTGKAVGELTVTGASSAAFVTVNGEPAKSGRSVFSSSTITTPEGLGATINLGKAGKIAFVPNSTFTLSFDGKAIGGELSAGSITVLSAAQSVAVRTVTGELIQLNAGETAAAGSSSATKKDDDDDDDDDDDAAWWAFALIFGGAAVGIIYAATSGNDTNLGGGSTVISPVR